MDKKDCKCRYWGNFLTINCDLRKWDIFGKELELRIFQQETNKNHHIAIMTFTQILTRKNTCSQFWELFGSSFEWADPGFRGTSQFREILKISNFGVFCRRLSVINFIIIIACGLLKNNAIRDIYVTFVFPTYFNMYMFFI